MLVWLLLGNDFDGLLLVEEVIKELVECTLLNEVVAWLLDEDFV